MTAACKSRRELSRRSSRASGHAHEFGYAYLLALFMALALIISSQMLMENLATKGRREREMETIWRGEQCVRAIRLYYHKTGHYPQTFDDLESGLAELHFLRAEAEKNPMNKVDGTWRFIYVNSAGQIIGSVKYATLQQMAILDLNHGKIPKVLPGAVSAASLAAQSSHAGSQQSGSSSGLGQPENPFANLKPTGPVDGPVIGAFLTGVAGKTDAKSLIVYHGGKKYIDWEFIWNPIEDQMRAMQQQAGSSSGSLLPGLTNLPGLPIGLTGKSTSPTGTSGTSSAPPNGTTQTPSNPAGGQPPQNSN